MAHESIKWVQSKLTGSRRGQSLVEMALITPLLLLFFIGLFEVGYALRGYLVLVNVNREITRFAVRPNYLDFSEADLDISSVGYDDVAQHVFTVLGADSATLKGGELPVEYGNNTTLIISHIVADTNQPCEDIDDCDCSWFDTLDYRNNPDVNPWKDKIKLDDDDLRHPDMPGQSYQAKTYPEGSTQESRMDYESYTLELARQNDKFNCELLKKSSTSVPSVNNVVITELFYTQPQLIGFPVLSNSVTDPIPMYSHTAMRLTAGARDNTADTVGPGCIALPITFPEVNNPDNVPQTIDAYEGGGAGNFGWLTWNPGPSYNTPNYVSEELENPLLSKNDFIDAVDSTDTSLSIGDDVSGGVGAMPTNNDGGVSDWMNFYVGKKVLVPVYESYSLTGQNQYYRISHFAELIIEQYCLPSSGCSNSNDKRIIATFLGYRDDRCPADGSGGGGGGGGGGNASPVASDDTGTTNKNTAITIDVLSNDTDADGDSLSVTNLTGSASDYQTLTNNNNGTITFVPKNNATGTFTFSYTVSDGNGGTDTANIVISVVNPTATNSPPVAGNDSATTTAGTAIAINAAVNDSDPNGDTLTWANPSTPAHGTAVHNGNGTYTYTPTAGYTGTDSFTYQVSDGRGGTATATVTLTVNSAPATNTPPVAGDDTAVTTAGTLVTINVNANDSDPNGDSLVYTQTPVSGPSHGTVAYETFGKFRYTPAAGYTGADSFVYQISDGRGGVDTATVNITVNAAPTMHVSAIVVTEVVVAANQKYGRAVVTIVDGNGAVVQGATVNGNWEAAPNPAQTGSVTPAATNASGQVTYETAPKNATGTYRFCVTGVTKTNVTYQSGSNVETCDQN